MVEEAKTSRTKKIVVGGAAAGLFSAAILAAAQPQLQKWEGRRNYPYYDVVKILTVCDGNTQGKITLRYYTDAECDAMTGKVMQKTADQIRHCIPSTSDANVQVAVLVNAYNIGTAAFCKSSISRKLLAGDLVGGCNAMLLYNKARKNGQLIVFQGLKNRRLAERALCLKGSVLPSQT